VICPSFDEENWCGHGGFGGVDMSGGQVLLNEGIQLFLFIQGQWINLGGRCLGT